MTALNQERQLFIAPRFSLRPTLLAPIVAVVFAAVVGLALIAMIGVSVPKAIAAFVEGTVGSPYALAASLNRSAVFASDCGPHWGPPEFVNWSGYGRLWTNLAGWLAGQDRSS